MPPDESAPDRSTPRLERHRERLTACLPELHAFVRALAGPSLRAHEETEDLVQSVCREVLDHLGRFQEGGDAEFQRWVFLEARRKILSRARHLCAAKRDARRHQLDDDPDALARLALGYSSFSTPSRRMERKEEIERLEEAIDSLDEDQRTVLVLAHIAQLSRRDIAQQMGRSEGAVRMLLHRAIAELATRL